MTAAKPACAICGRSDVPLSALRQLSPAFFRWLHAELPDALPDSGDALLCDDDLRRLRLRFVEALLEAARAETERLGVTVVNTNTELAAGVLETEPYTGLNPDPAVTLFEMPLSRGQRIADAVARIGGSWNFIISFLVVLATWIVLNSAALFRPFDPYPFILLNLVLSCVAALQAPVIMMSQNRQAAKDRLEAEHDYQTNTKAELEIQTLQLKLDLLQSQLPEVLAQQQELQKTLAKLSEKPSG